MHTTRSKKRSWPWRKLSLDDLDGHNFHWLVDEYQTLHKVVSEAMKYAANDAKDSDKGYQFSSFLVKCSNAVKLW